MEIPKRGKPKSQAEPTGSWFPAIAEDEEIIMFEFRTEVLSQDQIGTYDECCKVVLTDDSTKQTVKIVYLDFLVTSTETESPSLPVKWAVREGTRFDDSMYYRVSISSPNSEIVAV